MQGDQKVSVQMTITVQSSGAQRLFDHTLQQNMTLRRVMVLL